MCPSTLAPLAGTEEHQPVGGIISQLGLNVGLVQGLADISVHHGDGLVVPVEHGLRHGRAGVALRPGGNEDVGSKPFSSEHLGHDLGDDLGRDGVVTQLLIEDGGVRVHSPEHLDGPFLGRILQLRHRLQGLMTERRSSMTGAGSLAAGPSTLQ